MVWTGDFRAYQTLILQSAVAGPLLGSALLLPLVLGLGLSPGLAWLLFLVPSLGVVLQALLPTLLAAVGGRLRLLTIATFLISETRGFWFALVLIAHARDVLSTDATVLALAAVIILTGVVGNITSNNLSVWYGLVLPDGDRRRLLPRVGTVSSAISAIVLWVLAAAFGPAATIMEAGFVAAFVIGGITSIVGVWGLIALPDPGRVRVHPPADDAAARAAAGRDRRFRRFCLSSTIAAAGGGCMPAVALLALGPLGLPPSFVVMLAAIGSTLTLLGSGIAASVIATLSASRVFRATQVARLAEVALILAAVAVPPAAPPLLIAVTMLNALTSAVNGIAGAELLYRMSGSSIVAYQGRYSGLTHGAFTVTSLLASALITAEATLPLFVVLLAASGVLRLVAAGLLDVSPSWRDVPGSRSGDAAIEGQARAAA